MESQLFVHKLSPERVAAATGRHQSFTNSCFMLPVEILQNAPYTSRSNSSPSLQCRASRMVVSFTTSPKICGGRHRGINILGVRRWQAPRKRARAVGRRPARAEPRSQPRDNPGYRLRLLTSTYGTAASSSCVSTTLTFAPPVDSTMAVPPLTSLICARPGPPAAEGQMAQARTLPEQSSNEEHLPFRRGARPCPATRRACPA